MNKVLNYIQILALGFIIIACGKMKHDVKAPTNFKADVDAKVDDGFTELFELCDNRYGYKTLESEQCIADGKAYRKLQVGIDLTSVEQFCQEREDEDGCFQDLTSLFEDALAQ